MPNFVAVPAADFPLSKKTHGRDIRPPPARPVGAQVNDGWRTFSNLLMLMGGKWTVSAKYMYIVYSLIKPSPYAGAIK